MIHPKTLLTLVFIVHACLGQALADSPKLIGIGRFSATMTDRTGLSEKLPNGASHDRLGGISAIEYTGENDEYLVLSDRGHDDGETTFQCRMHSIRITIDPVASDPVKLDLIGSQILRDSQRRPFVGESSQLQASENFGHRLDPEGLRIAGPDQLLICEEYGPTILKFDRAGTQVGSISVPLDFQIEHPAAGKNDENRNNKSGRASNKGLEGIAISPDGNTLTCVMQNVMLQDGRRDKDGKPKGNHCRLLQVDCRTGRSRQFVYRLDDPAYVLSEILAISATQFLVIERDGESGDAARCKQIKQIDLSVATDISDLNCLPPDELPGDIRAAEKSTYLDMLDAKYALAGVAMPEKLEGLAFGPDLPDGRRTLVIAVDNDFEKDADSLVYVFGCNL